MPDITRLAELAKDIPATCTGNGHAHEAGSRYCDDHDGEVPELLSESVSDWLDIPGPETLGELTRTADRVCAYLYAASAELRAAVAVFMGTPDCPDRYMVLDKALEDAACQAAGNA
jgi:hypothetical protein